MSKILDLENLRNTKILQIRKDHVKQLAGMLYGYVETKVRIMFHTTFLSEDDLNLLIPIENDIGYDRLITIIASICITDIDMKQLFKHDSLNIFEFHDDLIKKLDDMCNNKLLEMFKNLKDIDFSKY